MGTRAKLAILAAVVALVVLAIYGASLAAQASAGAAYGARVACSCRYIGGRDLADCRKDFVPGMGLVALSENADERSVTARVFPIASETVVYRKEQGCVFAEQP